ncbi:MAG: TrmH family RNA methyltransferase [Neisseriaceae bacterium]
MYYLKIESKENNLVKKVVKLAKSSGCRKDNCLSVVYGEHLVEEAYKYRLLESIIIDENLTDKYKKLINKIEIKNKKEISQRQIKIYTTNRNILNKMNILDSEIEIIGVIRVKHTKDFVLNSAMMPNLNTDFILLENIQNPLNLGAIFRVARASGIENICLNKTCVDIYNPKVLRASQGLQFGLNLYTDVDIFQFVKNYPGQIIATTPNAQQNIYDLNLTMPVTFLFGNEGEGISKELLRSVKTQVKIPMAVGVDSLNVGMALTVCAFEMVRQRLC